MPSKELEALKILETNPYWLFPRGRGFRRPLISDKNFMEFAAICCGLLENHNDKDSIAIFDNAVRLYNTLNFNRRYMYFNLSPDNYDMYKLGTKISFQSYLEAVKYKPYRFPLKFDKKNIKPVKLKSKSKDKVELVELNQKYFQYDYFKYTDYIKP